MTLPLSAEQEQQLLTTASKIGCLISTEMPPHPSISTSRPEKLKEQLANLRNLRDGRGRIHPDYSKGHHGLRSRNPTLESFPWECFLAAEGYQLLDLPVSTDPMMIAKSVRQMDLFEELLTSRVTIGDLLQKKYGLDKPSRQLAKMAFYELAYARSPEANTETLHRQIAESYPKLLDITRDNLRAISAQVRINVANMWLLVAQEVANIPECRVVGFWHSEPLVECPVGQVAAVTTQLTDCAYDLLAEAR